MFTTIKGSTWLGSPTSKTSKRWTDILRFVHDPISIDFNHEDPIRYRSCGTVLVRKEVKDTIDSVFQEIFKIDIEYKMDTPYGDIISEVSKEMCELAEFKHLKICRCNYEKSRIWAHDFYTMLMQKFAKIIKKTEKELKEIITDFRIKTGKFLRKYEWKGGKLKVMRDDEALVFIISSLFSKIGHLNIENLEQNDLDLLDKQLFEKCKNNKCTNNHKRIEIWKSESEIPGDMDRTSVNRTRPMSFIKARNYKIENNMIPRAKIFFNECKCSKETGVYELIDYSKNHKGKSAGKNKKLEKVFLKYFNKDHILSKAQANVAAKLMTRQCIPKAGRLDSGERHTKILLKKNIRKWSEIAALIPDLESAMKTDDLSNLFERLMPNSKLINKRKK